MLGIIGEVLEGLDQRFEVTENRMYVVDGLFPRLQVPGAGRPSQVVRVDYDLDLTSEPPRPLPDAVLDELYALVGTAA